MAYATVPNTSFADPLGDLLQNLPPTVRLFIEAAKKNCRVVFILRVELFTARHKRCR